MGKEINDKTMTTEKKVFRRAMYIVDMISRRQVGERMTYEMIELAKVIKNEYDHLGAKYSEGDIVYIFHRSELKVVKCKVCKVLPRVDGYPRYYLLYGLTGRNCGNYMEAEIFLTEAEARREAAARLTQTAENILKPEGTK